MPGVEISTKRSSYVARELRTSMIEGRTREIFHARAVTSPRASLMLVGLGLALPLYLASAMFLQSGLATFVFLAVLAGVTAVFARALTAHYPHPRLGLCNVVTFFRAALVCFLFGMLFAPGVSGWLVFAIATVAFSLDGIDGWLARRAGLVSVVGARFDMETDAALAAVLSLWLLVSGTTGAEILVLGFTRYAFVLVSYVLPALKGSLFPSWRRKAICVVQIAALILLVCPLTPNAAIPAITLGATALLLWSFSVDTMWLLRQVSSHEQGAGRRPSSSGIVRLSPGGRQVMRVVLAAVILHLVLILPHHPGGLAGSTLARFPLELPVLLLLLLALGRSWATLPLRVAVTAALLGLTVFKLADLAMFSALARAFNPLADLALAEAGYRLLIGAIGPVLAVLALLGAIIALGFLGLAVWWATGILANAAPASPRWQAAVGGAACLAGGLAVADVGDRMERWDLPYNTPGAARSTVMAIDKLQTARATLRDLQAFEAAAASDPFAGTPGLLDLIDRDVIVVFLESYGRTSLDNPLYADLHRPTLAEGQVRLEALGLSTASGILSSPTRGGQSWLAHASFANGLWVNSDTRYRAALASERQTLFHLAANAGFETAAVMPQITLDWPESSRMGFRTVLAADDLGYAGLNFNWVTMPDQFTYAALDRILRQQGRSKKAFIQVATGSSHAPWVPVPTLVPWDRIEDGAIFNDMATAGDTPQAVWRDRDRVRAQYRLAVDYALQAILSYAEKHGDEPPLLVVMGDHQAAGFVAQDDRPDVPIHVIGPAHLVDRTMAWGLSPGLIPPKDAPVIAMDRMRDLFLSAFSSVGPHRQAAK
jgi:phosphatidylglycerophosphate synthase